MKFGRENPRLSSAVRECKGRGDVTSDNSNHKNFPELGEVVISALLRPGIARGGYSYGAGLLWDLHLHSPFPLGFGVLYTFSFSLGKLVTSASI